MGLLDGHFDPEQFQASGGLLGRLLSLSQLQGLSQPSMDLDPHAAPDGGQAGEAQMSVPFGKPPADIANPVDLQMPVYRPTQSIPIGGSQLPQFGSSNVAPVQQPPYPGGRPSAGFPSWAHTPAGNPVAGPANGTAGLSSGRRTDAINTSDAHPSGNGRAGGSSEGSSPEDQHAPGLSKVGYLEIPANPNQAFGELLGIQERNEGDTISKKDHVSGVREGNIRRREDGSLEVTNGTVVSFSYKDGSAKTVTVTGEDVAYIDATTGEVVIQKSF